MTIDVLIRVGLMKFPQQEQSEQEQHPFAQNKQQHDKCNKDRDAVD
ncbi:hypothetical protein [Leptolyngbya sp. FACHB-261]|nr:hypothetical protein [Leptolyngbya sp. FACHB-261]MBD2101619.1 hypothetical protein [Leptolyngbya sp. FACHB-261]